MSTESQPAGRMMLLPPAKDKCQLCAVAHAAEAAHNAQSLFYQTRFQMQHGRAGTWADAIAHCPPDVRSMWERELRRLGGWSEPPEGVEPIAEAIEP